MQVKIPDHYVTECATCSHEFHTIVVKGRPRFWRRDAKGNDRNITHCPGCGARLESISADQVRAQTNRTP